MSIETTIANESPRKQPASASLEQAPADAEVANEKAERGSGRLRYSRFWLKNGACLVTFAGVLTLGLTAAAQEGSDDPQGAPPTEASPEASPSIEASAEQGAATPEASPDVGEAPPEGPVSEGEAGEVVIVTGYGSSLSAALRKKQNTTGQVDAIVAEDIADFPDLNLAESLQRLPGVSITRTYGEGAQITVRGLSGLYTRVRVNGIESRAAVGNNVTRNFDFSVFASELFNSIVVHKTASAELDEGSLGAVIDLNTARAFNYDEGFTFVAGATAAYNDLSQTVRPRLTGLVAYRDPGGVWGATASVAYSAIRADSASTDTVRWQRGAFRSVNGVTCMDNPMDPGCLEVNGGGAGAEGAQHPRIPRYGQEVNTAERLGVTAGVQFRPSDKTEVRLDGLYARYDFLNDRRWLEVLVRGTEGTIDVSNYRLQQFPLRYGATNNTLIAAELDNAQMRSERNPIDQNSRFYQLTLAADHWFTDNFWVNALAGTTRSRGKSNDATVDYDNRNYNDFSYDYSDDEYPVLAYRGLDVNDPATYQVTELRDRYARTLTGFDTAELALNYDIVEQLNLVAGVNLKRATLDTEAANRDGLVCALGLFNCDTNGDGTQDVFGPPGEAALSDAIEYPGEVGAGSNTRWASPQVDAWFDRLGYRNVPLVVDQDGSYEVKENNLGFFLQAKGDVPLTEGGMRLQYDAGVRYVQTRQTSQGFNSGLLVTIDRPMYDDVLPSANAALWFNEQIALRLAAARVMARPVLQNLSPGGTVDSFNYDINNQNPLLEPTRANAIDLAAEWYFSEGSLLALALFFKDVDSFPIRASRTGTFASTGLPGSVIQGGSPASLSPNFEGTCPDPVTGCWQISELTNGPGATIKGLELAFQTPFSTFVAGVPVISDMGFVANFTLVDSEAEYDFLGTTVTERLTGLSNRAYNATLYYEDAKFGARLSLAHRSNFLNGAGPNQQGNLWEYTEAETRLDFSSSYTVNEYVKISLEALNLLDTPISTKVDTDAERRVLYNHTGRNFLLGARFNY